MVKAISRVDQNDPNGADCGRSGGNPCRLTFRPIEASKAAVRYVRNTSLRPLGSLTFYARHHHPGHFKLSRRRPAMVGRIENLPLGESNTARSTFGRSGSIPRPTTFGHVRTPSGIARAKPVVKPAQFAESPALSNCCEDRSPCPKALGWSRDR